MITTIDEMKEYLVKELNQNLDKLMEGCNDNFAIYFSGRCTALRSALANLGYEAKTDVKLEKED